MIKVLVDSVSGENPFPGSQTASSRCVLTWREGQGAVWGLFIRTLIPSWGLHPHNLIIS